MTMALLLKRKKREVVICERLTDVATHGHAFLMNYEGLSVLRTFLKESEVPLLKQHVNLFSLRRPDNNEKIKIQLFDWYCMKRVDLIDFLRSFFCPESLKGGRNFSHFIYENERAVAAVFENGDVEYGDVFIGADGSNSRVRQALFGETKFTPNEVNEIVGISSINSIGENGEVCFRKFQSESKGLAFGYIPVSAHEAVWFLQYDVRLPNTAVENTPESISSFCSQMVSDFPDSVKEVLDGTDFKNAYIWKTRDFDLLPSFHKENVVLMGDAAHLALPFTSAGTSNAISDAKCLAEMMEQCSSLEAAFSSYYSYRAPVVEGHVEQGRLLKETFLYPERSSERSFMLPLIAERTVKRVINKEKVHIIYFTDPICSTCWVIQPILRKLKLEYGDSIEMEYHMGGLLPSWKNYDKGIIKTPQDAARHWEEVNLSQKMILSGDIWIEDPLHSSYPPSIAFNAAQLQDNDKAITFLRRLKELIFIEKKNITRWEIIEEAALSCGLDSALLREDINNRGVKLFEGDLEFAKELNIRVFPTFLFLENNQIIERIEGYHDYQRFEQVIRTMRPGITKSEKVYSPREVFELFNNMTEDEFAFITNTSSQRTTQIMSFLQESNVIRKVENKLGIVWMYNLNTAL